MGHRVSVTQRLNWMCLDLRGGQALCCSKPKRLKVSRGANKSSTTRMKFLELSSMDGSSYLLDMA